jgi:copper chaperone CopZ
MKKIKFIIIAVFAVVLSMNTFAQAQNQSKVATTKTDTISVSGNCGMCKARIEKAAKIDGVSKAEWDEDTKVLTFVYDPAKVKIEDVQKKVASVGHDTGEFKADDQTYNNLPGCCKYR